MIRCSVYNRFNHPDVLLLASGICMDGLKCSLSDNSSTFPILAKKHEAPFFIEGRLSTAVFITDSARLNDSEVYNCTAYSGGQVLSASGLNFNFSEGTVATTRSIEVVVQST